jgi:hypothetical protein
VLSRKNEAVKKHIGEIGVIRKKLPAQYLDIEESSQRVWLWLSESKYGLTSVRLTLLWEHALGLTGGATTAVFLRAPVCVLARR